MNKVFITIYAPPAIAIIGMIGYSDTLYGLCRSGCCFLSMDTDITASRSPAFAYLLVLVLGKFYIISTVAWQVTLWIILVCQGYLAIGPLFAIPRTATVLFYSSDSKGPNPPNVSFICW